MTAYRPSYKRYLISKMEKADLNRTREPLRVKYCTPNYFHNNYYLANDELPPERSSLKFPASREIFEYV
jgi:hypothetical protein